MPEMGHHLKHGHCPDREWVDRCLCPDPADSRSFQLLCAMIKKRSGGGFDSRLEYQIVVKPGSCYPVALHRSSESLSDQKQTRWTALFNQASLTAVIQVSEKFMRTSFRFALTLLACGMAAPSLPAAAQVLDATLPMQYIPLEIPCRAVDTRVPGGAITAGTTRNFSPGGGGCSVPTPTSGVIAYAMNITVVPHGQLNYLTVWPAGELQPLVSTLNSPDGRIKANAAIVTGGTNGQISVFASNTTDVVLDVSGYFVAEVPVPPTYTFFPITPCRVVDTRVNNGTSFGAPSLVAGQQRAFVLSLSSCNLPTAPEDAGGAFSVNVTVVPKGGKPVGYVTVWGTSVNETATPPTSTLNAPTGTLTANAAIITVNPATGGSLSVFSSDETDLVIDVNGYFAFSQLVPGGLSLYTLPPCRILDTRPSGEFEGERTVTVTTGNNCSVSGTAKAYVLNATVVPPQPLGYLTLWQNGAAQPGVSTLNAVDGEVTSNMAIVQTTNGSIDAFAPQTTQLVLDISAYFAP
jgi:hypothetical protein